MEIAQKRQEKALQSNQNSGGKIMLLEIREELIEACRMHPSQTPEIIIERALDEFSRHHMGDHRFFTRLNNYVQDALGLR